MSRCDECVTPKEILSCATDCHAACVADLQSCSSKHRELARELLDAAGIRAPKTQIQDW